jgi:hypothetical protein
VVKREAAIQIIKCACTAAEPGKQHEKLRMCAPYCSWRLIVAT